MIGISDFFTIELRIKVAALEKQRRVSKLD